jgi:hypothetical protein
MQSSRQAFLSIKRGFMANQNGRNVSMPDENRPDWRPQDDSGQRNRRSMSEDDDRFDRDEDRSLRGPQHWEDRTSRWDRDEGYRSTERYGQGQSGYGAGRYEEDRGFSSRNMGYPSHMDERARERGLDERFSQGRGGSSWGERDEGRGGRTSGYGHGEYRGRGGYLGPGGQQMGSQQGYGRNEGQWGNEGYTGMRDYGSRGQGMYYGPRGQDQTLYGQGDYGPRGPGMYGARTYGSGNQGMYGQGFGQGSSQGMQGGYGSSGSWGQGEHQVGGMYGHGPGSWSQGDRDQDMQRGSFGGPQGQPMRRSHRGKGPSGYMRSDERIREMVCEALSDDHDVDATNIDVTVKSGEVILSGTVEDRRQKRIAEDVAEQVSGVKDVQNQIRVAHDTRSSSTSKESEATTSSPKDDKKARA